MKIRKWMVGMTGLLVCGLCLASCTEDENIPEVPPVEEEEQEDEKDNQDDNWIEGIVLETPTGGFKTPRCQTLTLSPVVKDGKSYDFQWSIKDSILSNQQVLDFISVETGKQTVTLSVIEKGNQQHTGQKNVTIQVVSEKEPYSPYIASILDFRPAPGQFVNELPKYEDGDTQEDMNQKVMKSIGNNARSLVSLGGFGGYVVCGFDHTIVNVPGAYDFKILGNAFYAADNPNPNASAQGGSMEPGIVLVAYDRNGNGKPDADEWYELAGSEYNKETTSKNYSITYFRPDPDKEPAVAPENEQHWNVDAEYIEWNDNKNNTGYIPKNSFHNQNYYPNWIEEDELTFEGTCLPNNAVDESVNKDESYWVLYAFDWGYADNFPNNEELSNFKIEWAVDKNGTPVHLPGIDFIKIYTGVNQCAGWLGETSTEVMGINDLHLLKK